jgi:hypothetical protein
MTFLHIVCTPPAADCTEPGCSRGRKAGQLPGRSSADQVTDDAGRFVTSASEPMSGRNCRGSWLAQSAARRHIRLVVFAAALGKAITGGFGTRDQAKSPVAA